MTDLRTIHRNNSSFPNRQSRITKKKDVPPLLTTIPRCLCLCLTLVSERTRTEGSKKYITSHHMYSIVHNYSMWSLLYPNETKSWSHKGSRAERRLRAYIWRNLFLRVNERKEKEKRKRRLDISFFFFFWKRRGWIVMVMVRHSTFLKSRVCEKYASSQLE